MTRLFPLVCALVSLACASGTELGSAASPSPAGGDGSALLRNGAGPRRGVRSLDIPHGEPCLAWLRQHGIAHRIEKPRPGMQTPVAITGPVGGVRYYTVVSDSLVCDCRLAVALHWAAPQLRALGVTAVRHSGAYVYRTTRSGRMSLHALGLAIDVHELEVGRERLSVEESYRRGLANGCAPGGTTVNRVACQMDQLDLFKELITPDDNRDHHDHLHLAIAPL